MSHPLHHINSMIICMKTPCQCNLLYSSELWHHVIQWVVTNVTLKIHVIGPEIAYSIWEACHHQGTGWTEGIGNYCCYLRPVTALLAGYLKVYLFKLVLVCNPVCRSIINVELHWLLYMVSRVFRGCVLLTIIDNGKTSLKSLTLCCTCYAV